MKRRLVYRFMVALILIVSLSVGVFAIAQPRANTSTGSLTFDGMTAKCVVNIYGNNAADTIKATVKLWDGNTCLKTWTASASGFLFFSETYTVSTPKRYKMTVDYTINGTSYSDYVYNYCT